MVAVGILLVNLHSTLRWYWYRNNIKKLEETINGNIVATTCPEYWTKMRKCSADNKCYEQCANIPLIKKDEIYDEDIKKYKVYTDKDVAFPLEYINNLTNQQKCWLVGNDFPTPWMEINKKCEAAHV